MYTVHITPTDVIYRQITLKPSFLIANMTSIMYWTLLSSSALCRILRNLSKTAGIEKMVNH